MEIGHRQIRRGPRAYFNPRGGVREDIAAAVEAKEL